MSILEHISRYRIAAHAVQSGVAAKKDKSDWQPKHLRVGINLTKAEQAGLATLLMEKGLFTREEYAKAMADAVEKEVAMYEQELNAELGVDNIHLS